MHYGYDGRNIQSQVKQKTMNNTNIDSQEQQWYDNDCCGCPECTSDPLDISDEELEEYATGEYKTPVLLKVCSAIVTAMVVVFALAVIWPVL